VSLAIWYSLGVLIGYHLGDCSSPTRRYNNLEFSITFPQTSCSKLFIVASFESLLCSLSSSSGSLSVASLRALSE
jgi:hypothetical protein